MRKINLLPQVCVVWSVPIKYYWQFVNINIMYAGLYVCTYVCMCMYINTIVYRFAIYYLCMPTTLKKIVLDSGR